ncbi:MULTISPECIES: hypothetical protein [Zobellia]|uniref:hypothetical protein n=1 Tax=Zobellia TaxID=112040 RepID=UPI000B53149E|nr:MULTISPECIES: hypothetical protein [Zobellia]MBU3026020.1 hypothetical protein [Zobellia galactanivorans]OWW23266.1 hypothetical protein B4Q04_21560 [Zobellia sp. OII3]
MSYTVFIHKFKDGDSAHIPFDELEQILSAYGKIETGSFGLEFISSVGEMFEYATLTGSVEDGISGISFDRPTLNETFPLLIFDLLKIKNTCFFGTDLEFVNSRYDMTNHYPKSLIENLPEKPKVISHPKENWPFE